MRICPRTNTHSRTVGCTLSAITVPVKAVVGLSVFGAVAGAVTLAVPTVSHYFVSNTLDQTAVKLKSLKAAVANGADLTPYHDYLGRSQFSALRKVAAEIRANREAVLEE